MNRSSVQSKSSPVAAVLAAAVLTASAAWADEAKHFRHYGPYIAPVRPVVVPAPVVTHRGPVHPPVVVHRYHGPRVVHHYGYPHYYHRGYWRDGRWIAPVVVGAAILGTIAAANSYAAPAPAVTYVHPAPVYHVPADAFTRADRDGNGFIDKWEASYDRQWERWFYDIDVNRDGLLSREELRAWSAGRHRY